jgi:diguanylate cyclase (GGDEF)-like protein
MKVRKSQIKKVHSRLTMKHVILFSGEDGETPGELVGALLEAGIRASTVSSLQERQPFVPDELSGEPPLAVLFDVAGSTREAELHEAIARESTAWPDVPLLLCLQRGANGTVPVSPWIDMSLLKQLGVHAVVDVPEALPALLRRLESGTSLRVAKNASETSAEATANGAPASFLLPERLGTEKLRAAFEMVASLHFAADQKGAASAALAGLAAIINADRWTIYLVSETGRREETTFEPLAARGLTPREHALPEGDWRRTVMGEALALTGAQSNAARAAVAYAETTRKKEGDRRTLAVPLISGDRVIGVLEAVREGVKEHHFTASDASLVSALALPLTAALTNSVRIAEAERLSQTDDLTKLHNARFLRQYLTGELKRARRYGSTVTTMFLDLDDFKQVNDRHGHLVGSHVLMEIAAVILTSVRDTDVVTRYGGDEFVIILPETGLDQASGVAERVRERLAGHAFTGGRNLRLTLTASFGIANFPLHAQSPQQLVAAADTAMYEAKAAHKNCIRYANENSGK